MDLNDISYRLIFYLFGLALGACMGSFVNVCIWRLPRGESIVRPSSRCPQCQTPIPWYDNLPLISYWLLKGHCRVCGTRISFRYFLVEALSALLYLFLFYHFGLHWRLIPALLLTSALLAISFIDWEHYLIPNKITYPGIVLGLVFSFMPGHPNYKESVAGLILGWGLFHFLAWVSPYIFKREALGFGDVKLAAMLGAFMGWKALLFTIFLASFWGALIGLAWQVFSKKNRQEAIPFGPFLAGGALFALFFGQKALTWYSHLFPKNW